MPDSHSNDLPADQQLDDQVWDIIAAKVDALVAAWEDAADDQFPCLATLVEDVADSFRRVVLWELIKIDLEYRWSGLRAPTTLEHYAAQLPELGGIEALPVDLIYEEVKIRGQFGAPVELHELPERFPHQADSLQQLLGTLVPRGMSSASMAGTAPTLDSSSETDESLSLDELSGGDTIDDFDLLLLLGSGSFARVFLARQRSLERLVALKVSRKTSTEPRTLAQLDHPNIVRVFDHRTCQAPPLRLLYMELVPGGTLQDVTREVARREQESRDTLTTTRQGLLILDVVDQRLSQSGVAPPEGSTIRSKLRKATWPMAVCELGARLADGLAYAHQKGVLHRDIKPANVLLTPEGSPKLADFNVSYHGGRADENPEDTFGGSLAYMSPEQLAACHPALGGSPMHVREASDIYSLGVVLWEVATGHRPFDEVDKSSGWAAMLQRMIDQRRHVDTDQLAERLPRWCPASLRDVLVRCLTPNKNARFRSAQQLADALRLCLNPRCWSILQPPRRMLTKLPLQWPVTTVLLLTLMPSILAAVFNLFYNRAQIIQYLQAEATFDRVQAVINAIAFPVGIGITVMTARRAARALRAPPQDEPSAGGSTALLLGRNMARIALTLWFISGLAYPASLHTLVPNPESITIGVYLHFALSLALCGILAGTYPFFFVTVLGIRWFLPEMIRRETIRGPACEILHQVRTLNRLFLVLTAFVPLLGILLILISSQSDSETLQTARLWLIIASATGLVGFGCMYALHRMIDEDALALRTISPDADDHRLS